MDVKDGLTSIGVRVDHCAIPTVGNTLLLRDFGGEDGHSPDDLWVAKLVERWHVLAGDDQNMRGRLRIDVAEGNAVIGLRDDLRGNLVADDATEETIFSHARSPR